jgi:tRNA G46 methylase TrmB
MPSTIQPITSYLKPRKVFYAIRRRVEIPLFTCIDVLFDAIYNITTHSGRISARSDNVDPAFQDDAGYEPMSYFALQRLLKQLLIVPGEVFVDIGCGRGRVVCVFARQRAIAKCVGVEYQVEYAKTAQKNAAKLRGRKAPICIVEGNAAEQNYDDATLIFLFNPFG